MSLFTTIFKYLRKNISEHIVDSIPITVYLSEYAFVID